MRIAVTGCAGLIGSHVVNELLKWGHSVWGVDNLSTGRIENVNPKLGNNFYQVDLRNKNTVNLLMKIIRPETIWHCAAFAAEGLSPYCPSLITENNVTASMNLLSASIRQGVKRIVFTSCHDEETKLVTKSGLKKWDEISKEDIVFTLNNKTGLVEEKAIISIKTYDYDGEMIGIKGRRINQLITPNHRVLYLNSPNKHPKIAYENAEFFIKRAIATIPFSKGWVGKDFEEYYFFPKINRHWNCKKEPSKIKTSDLFYLIGLFVADGIVQKMTKERKSKTGLTAQEYVLHKDSSGRFYSPQGKTNFKKINISTTYRISFCVPGEDKAREKLERILKRNGYVFSNHRRDNDAKSVLIINSFNLYNIFYECGHLAENKHFPSWTISAKQELLEQLFNGCMDGDGNKLRTNLTTVSTELVTNMIEVCLKLGKMATFSKTENRVSEIKGRKIFSSPCFRLSVAKTNLFITRKNFYKKPYQGKVWCLEVENGNFLIERNRKYSFSGNSFAAYGSQKPPFTEETPLKPVDVYGVTKQMFEETLRVMSRAHGFEYVIIRPHNVIGRNQALHDPYRNVVGIWMNRLLQDKPYYINGDGTQQRAFSPIQDFAPIIVKCGFVPEAKNEIFNIGADKPFTLNQLSDMILDITGKKLKPIYMPSRHGDVQQAWCNNDKAKKILGFEDKTSLYDCLKDMWQWAVAKGPFEFKYLPYLELINEETPKLWVDKML